MIAVVGVGADGRLAAGGEDRLREAAFVVGAARHLRRFAPAMLSTLELAGDLDHLCDAVAEHDGGVVILASGDPGFFGIVRKLAERFGRDALEVLPGVSSVASVFGRAGMPWDDAIVVSAHGRDPRAAVNACRAYPKVAVLTSPAFGPAQLAAALTGLRRRLVVAEALGEPDERVVEADPAQVAAGTWRDPNVVVVFDPERGVGPIGRAWPPRRAVGSWALPEDAFEHRDRMITKAEVRALVLARLGPGPGDLVWDVGAGSGSVAVECARLGAAAIAVERDPGACELIRRNAERHDVEIEVVLGEAPDALHGLVEPDAVFVGGGGDELGRTLEFVSSRARRAVVVALASVERVVPAVAVLRDAGLDVEATMLHASRLEPAGPAHRLAATNPVFVVAATRR